MNPLQVEAIEEFLKIVDRVREEKGNEDDKSASQVHTFPRTNTDFESCRLRDILAGQLEAHLGERVNQTVGQEDLYFTDNVQTYSSAVVEEIVAGLEASQTFRRVVDESRAAIQRAGGLLHIRSALGRSCTAATTANNSPIDGVGALTRRGGLSDSDAEGEGAHVKKVPRRDDSWTKIFDVLGPGFGMGRGFGSPRVDVEGALEQLRAGLVNTESTASSVEALGLLAEADPELFQFGNHWPPFLELARRALDSVNPAVHAKAMTLHWVMYEKSMGMCAADICESVLAHAKRRFATNIHVLSSCDTTALGTAAVPVPLAPLAGGEVDEHMMIVGDSELACAAREAKALHGMLTTIHEAFQHLPESRVWDIVSDFLSLFGDVATISLGLTTSDTNANSDNGIPASASGDNPANGNCEPGAEVDYIGGSGGSGLFVDDCKGASDKGSRRGDLARYDTIVSPAHFLAVAGRVEEWLPGLLKVVSTGRLVRAVQEAGLVTVMTRRCDARGRIILHRPGHNGGSDVAMNTTDAVFRKTIQRHRLCSVTGSCDAPHLSGRAMWLPVADLESALTKQSVSFLGIVAAHCRGILRPCPPPQTDNRKERTRTTLASKGGAEVGDEDCDNGLRQGQDVVAALVRAVSREVSAASATSASVGRLAMEYIRRLAIATAGAEPNPFIRSVVDELFTTLAGVAIDGGGEVGDGGPTRCDCGVLVQEEGIPVDLEVMVDIAGTLLSSRCATYVFFVEGAERLEASLALLSIVRIATAFARAARSFRIAGEVDETLENRESGVESRKGIPLKDFSIERVGRILRGKYLVQLAVEFSCALSSVMGLLPKPRAAAWKALWQYDYPRAVSQLVATLDRSECDKADIKSVDARKCLSSGGAVNCNSIRGADTKEYVTIFRHRLLLSLAEWARNLSGANYLRWVGLISPCSFILSRELALRHLHPGSRDEYPDAYLLALAARLAMYPEGFDALVSADGGVSDAVDLGLGNLSGLANLAEMLESRRLNLPPPPLRLAASPCSAEGDDERADYRIKAMHKPVIGSGPADLRCLDFARRFSSCWVGNTCRRGRIGRGFSRVRSWWRWTRTVLAPRTPLIKPGESAAWKEGVEGEGMTEDVQVVAMELAATVAADASAAAEMEARWFFVEALALWKAKEVAGDGIAVGLSQHVEDEGAVNGVVSPVIGGGWDDADGGGTYSGNEEDSASVFDVVGVLEPVSLTRARLAISLACLGGPTEERHVRMGRIRAVSASAALTSHSPSGQDSSGSGVVLSRNDSRPMAEAIEFPSDGLSDGEWWDAAAQSALSVAAALSKPGEHRNKEALDVLKESISRRSLVLPEVGRRREASRGSYVSVKDKDDERRDAKAAPGAMPGAGVTLDRMRAVMRDMCFSYARSVGLVDGSVKVQFAEGWRATMAAADAAAAEEGVSSLSKSSVTAAECCDWFAALVFLVCGSDGKVASEMLTKARGHPNGIIFLWPLAGEMYAAAAEDGAEAIAAASHRSTCQAPLDGGNDPFCGDISHDAALTAAAVATLGDPPLLVLAALVEEVLEEELPCMATALRRSGWAAAQLAARWMWQCLLGIVDWSDAVAYMVLALLRGHDYQVYFVVALLRAGQPRVVDAASAGLDLSTLLLEGEALEGFQFEASIAFMEGLEQRHRGRCLEAMRAFIS